MSLGRAWTRQLFGASGAALLVPGMIVCALAVLAFAGGFARPGSIGQALSGPAAPPTVQRTTAASDSRAVAKLGSALAAVGAPAPARPSGAAASGGLGAVAGFPGAGGSSRSGGSGGGGSSGRPGSGGGGAGSGSGGGSGGQGGGGQSGGGGQGGGGGRPQPPAGTTVVDGVVSVGASVTSKVPGPVGALATQTLQSVGSAVDKLLPLKLSTGAKASTQFSLLGLPRR